MDLEAADKSLTPLRATLPDGYRIDIGGSSEELGRTTQAHTTMSEAVKEAAPIMVGLVTLAPPPKPDPEKVAAYVKLAGPVMQAAGAKFLVRGNPTRVYEAGLMMRTVVIEFDSVQQAMEVHDSPGYQEALKALANGAERDMRIMRQSIEMWEGGIDHLAAKLGLDPSLLSQLEPEVGVRVESLIAEEMGWGDSGLAVSLAVSSFPLLTAQSIGNQELVDLCTDKIGCWMITNPSKGSDVMVYDVKREWPQGQQGNRGNILAQVGKHAKRVPRPPGGARNRGRLVDPAGCGGAVPGAKGGEPGELDDQEVGIGNGGKRRIARRGFAHSPRSHRLRGGLFRGGNVEDPGRVARRQGVHGFRFRQRGAIRHREGDGTGRPRHHRVRFERHRGR